MTLKRGLNLREPIDIEVRRERSSISKSGWAYLTKSPHGAHIIWEQNRLGSWVKSNYMFGVVEFQRKERVTDPNAMPPELREAMGDYYGAWRVAGSESESEA